MVENIEGGRPSLTVNIVGYTSLDYGFLKLLLIVFTSISFFLDMYMSVRDKCLLTSG